jgi:ABC-2 type transport system permease protein
MTDASVIAPSPGVPRAAVKSGARLWVNSFLVAERLVRKFARTPQLIAFTTIQSALFPLMFRFAFGGAIGTGGSLSYVSFLVPGFIATTVLWSGMGAAAGVAEDVEHGFVDRLLSLPIPPAAVLIGRSLADTALIIWGFAMAWCSDSSSGSGCMAPSPKPWPRSGCAWYSASPLNGSSS